MSHATIMPITSSLAHAIMYLLLYCAISAHKYMHAAAAMLGNLEHYDCHLLLINVSRVNITVPNTESKIIKLANCGYAMQFCKPHNYYNNSRG